MQATRSTGEYFPGVQILFAVLVGLTELHMA